MRVAGLDSSGPNYKVIGIITGEPAILKALYYSVRGGRKRLHLRKMGRRDREEIAQRFLNELKGLRGVVRALYIRTGVAEALAEARHRFPYTPSSRIRKACLSALASFLVATLADLGVKKVYCDHEVAELLRVLGLDLRTGGYPAELADVVAWLGHKVESGRWDPKRAFTGLLEVLDCSGRLKRLTLEKLEKRRCRAHINPRSPASTDAERGGFGPHPHNLNPIYVISLP